MHALEKKALSDPFLADALEGASQITAEDLEADLKNTSASLADRVQGKAGKDNSILGMACTHCCRVTVADSCPLL